MLRNYYPFLLSLHQILLSSFLSSKTISSSSLNTESTLSPGIYRLSILIEHQSATVLG